MSGVASGWATLRAHRTPVRTLDASRSGLNLLSGDEEGYVALWSLETRRPLAIWRAHENALLTTEFWQRGEATEELIVTHGRDNKMRIWNNPLVDQATSLQHFNAQPIPLDPVDPSEQYLKPWLVYTQDVNALNFCPIALSASELFAAPATTASERIDVYKLDASFSISRPFKALDAAEGLPLDTQLEDESAQMQRRGQLGTVMAMKISGTSLLAGYESGHVAHFDLNTGAVTFVVQPNKSPILSLALDGEHSVFASAADRKISVVNISSGEYQVAAQLTHRGVASIDVLSDARLHGPSLLVTAGWDGKVRLFEDIRNSAAAENIITEIDSFSGGRQSGITAARICAVDHSQAKRRLMTLPDIWVIVAGKDSRIGLNALKINSIHNTQTGSKGGLTNQLLLAL